MATFDDFFTQLFYGTGNILGLIILCAALLLIALMHKYSGVVSFAVGLIMSFNYFDNLLGWHGIIAVIMSLFCAFITFDRRKD